MSDVPSGKKTSCVFPVSGLYHCAWVSGSRGTSWRSTPTPGSGKMSFGPCPSQDLAIGAPTKAVRIKRMMKIPLTIAILSCANRRHTCSQ